MSKTSSLDNRQPLQGLVSVEGSHRSGSSLLPALLACAFGMAACGSSGNAVVDQDAASMMDASVAIGTIVRGTSQPCTEAHTVCVNAKFPASMTTQATRLQIDYYAQVPPTHPPDGIPLMIDLPQLAAGEMVQLRMTDGGLTGSFFFLGIVFMPGGGYQIPLTAVDYTGNSSASYALTGAAFNLPVTLDFQFAP
jgi:hypothetical protein